MHLIANLKSDFNLIHIVNIAGGACFLAMCTEQEENEERVVE